jgi:eukaryotic-like serine/threonine-protein kinase
MKQCPHCHLHYPNESTYCFVDGGSLVTVPDPRIGSTIAGRYVIEREIGVGGMAAVYQAHHLIVERPCAIKILNRQYAEDPILRERFVREARHAQRVAHPNVIEIFDQGETEERTPFLVMELLVGTSLAEAVGEGPLPLSRALPIAIEISRALARAHDFDVVHRDLKPENVFLLEGDRVKLLDFGIARSTQDARLTSLGELFGTPQYLAPERGSPLDTGPPADLYALGVMLFEMISGRLPFEADNPATWVLKHQTETPPHLSAFVPGVPEALDRLIFDLMAKDPGARPVDAHRVLTALGAISRAAAVPVPRELEDDGTPVSSAPRSVRVHDPWRHRLMLFERMLAASFPGGPPPDLVRTLDAIRARVREADDLRARAFEQQQQLEGVDDEGRDGRHHLGRAMEALATEASTTREEARALRARVAPLTGAARGFVPLMHAAHRDVVSWEGRSGLAEPYLELAAAYRRASELVEAWFEARRRELAAEAQAAQKERAIGDVDFQIRTLRDSLGALDRSLLERRQRIQQQIAEAGWRTQALETEIIQLATRLTLPLRGQPILGPLFAELERG